MRMRKSLKQKYSLRKRNVGKNTEGGSVVAYGAAISIEATIWAAGGKTQAEMYGERLAYMKNMEYEGTEEIKEHDGICVNCTGATVPDYKVISIDDTYKPMRLTLERI